MLNSNAQASNSLGQYRNSRCGSDRYRDIRLTEGGLGFHELETEKSAEAIVLSGNELPLMEKSHKLRKGRTYREAKIRIGILRYSLYLKVVERCIGVKSDALCFTNRRIREPYVRWCERRTGGRKTVSRLLDYPHFKQYSICY